MARMVDAVDVLEAVAKQFKGKHRHPRRLEHSSSDAFRNLSSELYDYLGTVLLPRSRSDDIVIEIDKHCS